MFFLSCFFFPCLQLDFLNVRCASLQLPLVCWRFTSALSSVDRLQRMTLILFIYLIFINPFMWTYKNGLLQ
jgi:hypothetical protein